MTMHKNTKAMKKTRGQGMTEYIIIVALIAIAAIGVITVFGNNIKSLFGMSSDALAGDTWGIKRTQHSNITQERKTLNDFNQRNGMF